MSGSSERRTTPLSVLGLSLRTYNALRRAGYNTIEEVARLDDEQLVAVRNFGIKSLQELRERLQAWSLNSAYTLPPVLSSEEVQQRETQEAAFPQLTFQDLEAPIRDLRLPSEIHHALTRSGVRTIVHLVSLLYSGKPWPVRDLGDGEVRIIKECLIACCSSMGHNPMISAITPAEKGTNVFDLVAELHGSTSEAVALLVTDLSLENWWAWLTEELHERERLVLLQRNGLGTGEPQTLAEIATTIGVTRERVRQIEKKALRLVRSQTNSFKLAPWEEWFSRHLKDDGGLVSLQQIADWITGDGVVFSDFSPLGFARVLVSLIPGIQKVRGMMVYGLATTISPTKVISLVSNVLRNHQTSMSWDDLWTHFTQEWRGDRLPSESFVRTCARLSKNLIQNPDGTWGLEKWQRGITDDLVAALRSLGRPAHYSELAQMTGEVPRRVHAHLGRKTELFVWVGLRGTYGLAEWGLEPHVTYEDAIAEILEQAGHPLTFEEVLADLPAVRPYYDESSVILTLGTNARFSAFPNKTYGLSEWTMGEILDENYRLKRLFEGVDSTPGTNRIKPDLEDALDAVDDFITQLKEK